MELLLNSVFSEVAALLILASLIGLFGMVLRQPLIVSFILVGILAGPSGFSLVAGSEEIELLSELGIAVLLFLVGLKLDLQLIRSIGKVSLVAGLVQIAITGLLGLLIALLFGLSLLMAGFIAVAITFSSTIIIVKLLSDRREIDSLHGRIALGILIVQDLMVVLVMLILSAIDAGSTIDNPLFGIVRMLGFALLMILLLGLFMRYAAQPLLQRIARSPELLVIFAIGWASFIAAVGDGLGFSKELGGLLAGISLASTHYKDAISTRLTSLRDFLLLFFFIVLGARLELDAMQTQWLAATVFSVFVLIGKPLIVMTVLAWLGYRKRTSFMAGIVLAQISEFSLILVAMGQNLGHLNETAMGLITLVGLITIGLSTYMIQYSQSLYAICEPWLDRFERGVPHRENETQLSTAQGYDMILFGLGRYGSAMHDRLSKSGLKVLGVDFDPDNVRAWQTQGIPAIYGDMADPDFVAQLPLTATRWVIAATPVVSSALTHNDPRLMLVQSLREQGYTGQIAVAAQHARDAETLREKGADMILMPFVDAADQAADLVLGRQHRAAVPDISTSAAESVTDAGTDDVLYDNSESPGSG